MSQENPPEAQKPRVDEAMAAARALMAAGTPMVKVADKLREQGFDSNTVWAVMYRLESAQKSAQARAAVNYARGGSGNSDMAIGCIICLIGIAVTYFTYTSASSNPGGGSYVVAWGAIIFGAIRFIRGLMSSR